MKYYRLLIISDFIMNIDVLNRLDDEDWEILGKTKIQINKRHNNGSTTNLNKIKPITKNLYDNCNNLNKSSK